MILWTDKVKNFSDKHIWIVANSIFMKMSVHSKP